MYHSILNKNTAKGTFYVAQMKKGVAQGVFYVAQSFFPYICGAK